MTSTSTTQGSIARRRIGAAAFSLALVAGMATAGQSSASAAPHKAKAKFRITAVRKAVTTPVAIPSAALVAAPAWQTSG